MAKAQAWQREFDEKGNPIPGLYYRKKGNGKSYMLRTNYKGQRKDESLSGKVLEEVKAIRAILELNAQRGTPPFFYSDMKEEQQENAQAEKAQEIQEKRQIIAEEKKRSNNTVSQLWELTYWPERLSDTTLSSHDSKVIDGRYRRFIKPYFGNVPLQDLTKSHFIEFARQFRELRQPAAKKSRRGIKAEPKPYSDTVLHKALADVRHLWNIATEHGIVSGVFPGKSVIKSIKLDNSKKCYLEVDEVMRLLSTVAERRMLDRVHHDVFCYVTMAVFLGLRAGDIHGLTPQAIERQIVEETKNGFSRFVDFGLEPVQMMLNERLSLYPVLSADSPLFVTDEGKQRPEVPSRYFKIIQELGFNDVPKRINNDKERIDFHALRHTYATHQLVNGGVDQVKLKELMGHKKLEMTLRYVEIADHIKAEESRKILTAYNVKSLPAPAMLPPAGVRIRKGKAIEQ